MPKRSMISPSITPVLKAVMVRALVEMAATGLLAMRQAGVPVDEADMRHPGRTCRAACRVRQVGMYLAHVVFLMSMTRAGHLFARDRTTARFACLQVEEWREDAGFDRALDWLEPALIHWMARFAPPSPSASRSRKNGGKP